MRDDATYFPVPWLLSSRGHGVLALGDETHRHTLGTRRWRVEADGAVLDLRVVSGPRPADALRRFTALVGRQPRVADEAVLGPWLQASGDEAEALRTTEAAGAPLSLLQTYTHYLPCGDERDDRAGEQARTERAHAAGVSITTYVNPMVCTGYTEAYDAAAAAGALGGAPGGGPYRYRYVGSTQFEVSQYDFTAPPGDRAFQDVLAARSPMATTGGWRTSASTRRRTSSRPTGGPGIAFTTTTRSSTTAPRSGWRTARARRRSCASCGRAGPAPRATHRWCGAVTRRSTGATTGCALRSARVCRSV